MRQADWQQLDLLGRDGVDLPAINVVFVPSPESYDKVRGDVLNNSDFDVDHVDVAVILFDATGTPTAVNRTEITTVLGREVRGFEVFWPGRIIENPTTTVIEAFTNVLENSNFLRTFGGIERFQLNY